MVFNLGTSETLILLLIIVVLFFPEKLGEFRRNWDIAMEELKKGMEEARSVLEGDSNSSPTSSPAPGTRESARG